jgi:hypothetical protein
MSQTKNIASLTFALIFLHNEFIASSEKNLAIVPLPSNFTLFTSRADALAGNNAAYNAGTNATSGIKNLADSDTTFAGHTFTTSTLDKRMSAVARMSGATASVSRVTIAGSGAITSTTLDSVATFAKRGADVTGGISNAKIAYAGKAVDVQMNIQALYDNVGTTTGTPISEIVVTDGSAISRKTVVASMLQYSRLKDIFSAGVTNPLADTAAPTNYAFTVTGAAYSDSPGTNTTDATKLQNDKNVASFYITGMARTDLISGLDTSAASLTLMKNLLSQSKLKTITTESSATWTATQKTNFAYNLSQISSNTDRAKMKVLA